MSHSGQTNLLKLYARIIAPAGKVKMTNLICRQLRDYVTETVRNVCLEGFVYCDIRHHKWSVAYILHTFLPCHPDGSKCRV